MVQISRIPRTSTYSTQLLQNPTSRGDLDRYLHGKHTESNTGRKNVPDKRIYITYILKTDNPGQSDTKLWKAVITKVLSTTINIPVQLSTGNNQGHAQKKWHFDPSMESLLKSQANNICIRYKKISWFPEIIGSIFSPKCISPIPALKQITTYSQLLKINPICAGACNEITKVYNTPPCLVDTILEISN